MESPLHDLFLRVRSLGLPLNINTKVEMTDKRAYIQYGGINYCRKRFEEASRLQSYKYFEVNLTNLHSLTIYFSNLEKIVNNRRII
jgi:hypothetical protein